LANLVQQNLEKESRLSMGSGEKLGLNLSEHLQTMLLNKVE